MICPHCQTLNPASAKFCNNCGQALATPPASPGERKVVTVLFADVVGSTAMGERLDPELVTEVMNGAFAFMNRAVDRYGGTVSRLMGDAVLAIFGAPAVHEDDPERAVRAGLEIQAAARDYAARVQKQYAVEFNVRVGVHTGLAVLDQVGDRIRAEYTAMGDTPNVAARMQTAAVPGTVLVSADTHRLTQHLFDFEARGPLAVKGKSTPIEAYQVIGARAAPASARGLEGLRAPMVGREAEFARLQVRLLGLKTGQPGAWVTLTGEAGLGKSRLVAELKAAADLRQTAAEAGSVVWLEGRCISYGSAISYLPWREIMRQGIGAHENEPDDAVRARLAGSASGHAGASGPAGVGLAAEHLPFLETLLAVASPESIKAVQATPGDQLVQRMTAAVRAALSHWAQANPLVLVFEDLHWADEASLALLHEAAGWLAQDPILIIALMRPDKDLPAWSLAERARSALPAGQVDLIALEPLSSDDARSLLGMLLTVEDLPERVRRLILEKSEGNPFYVEEVIRSLLDSGHIVRAGGFWRATREIEQVAIPNNLAGLLAARMDALPDEPKRLAQMSAVIGRTFAYRVIKTICADAPPAERIADIQPPLDRLTRQEIVRVQARQPELEYAFKHALTQEAAYNSLLLRRRREFHGRVGLALERLYADRLEELAPVLAHHFAQAEDWERAAAYAQRAGDAALKVYALREAMRLYDRALEALDKTPAEHPAQICDAILGWDKAAFKFRPYPEQLERLKHAEQLARQLGDQRRLAETLSTIGAVHLASGHSMRAVPVLGEAFHLAEALGDEALAAMPSFHAAYIKMLSDPQAGVVMFDHALELARKHGNPDLEAYALSARGIALARLGRAAEARASVQSAFDVFKSRGSGSPITESDLELFAGWAYLDLDEPNVSLSHSTRSVECSIAADNFDCLCGGLACIGFGNMQSGKLPAAAQSFEQAIEHTKTSGAAMFEALARGGLALIQLAEGQAGAVPGLERAAARARELNDPTTEAMFLHATARARLAAGDLAGAQTYLDLALDYYQRNAMAPYLAQALATQAAINEKQRAT